MSPDYAALRILGLIIAGGACCIFVCLLYVYAMLNVLVVGDDEMAQEDEL